MEIQKILNNNVVIVLNQENEEIVLMGKGLGFQQKIGLLVDETKVEKIFRIENELQAGRVEELFAEIPEEIIELSVKFISIAQEKLTHKLNENAFIAIADHLNTSIIRQEQGIEVKNFLMWDIKRFYPKEFEISKKGLDYLNEHAGIFLPEDEAGYLALHLVNAQICDNQSNAVTLTQIIEEILTIIKYTLLMEFNEDDVYFQRFITHLKFFSEMVLKGNRYDLPDEVDLDLYELIVGKYPQAHLTTHKVEEYLKEHWNYQISKDEQLYITMHLARIMEKC
ncbi:MAG: PRD domain-containing protein [Streptococcaceae bacterium]|nr:PRD domain-containing protein [Streptococcaceae bacterium]